MDENTVYTVSYDTGVSDGIVGIFRTKEQADECAARHKSAMKVCEYQLDVEEL